MLKTKDILDEKDKRLRKRSDEVIFPLTAKDKKAIKDMIKYLHDSQIEELALKYDLRPGMGMAVGIQKRFFVIVYETTKEDDLNQTFETYIVVNPKIISHSEEIICAESGEGCLSVNRETEGYVKRYARVKVEAYDIDGNKITVRAREELAIAFQHEIDHLDGILFTDRIDKKEPFKNKDMYRSI